MAERLGEIVRPAVGIEFQAKLVERKAGGNAERHGRIGAMSHHDNAHLLPHNTAPRSIADSLKTCNRCQHFGEWRSGGVWCDLHRLLCANGAGCVLFEKARSDCLG